MSDIEIATANYSRALRHYRAASRLALIVEGMPAPRETRAHVRLRLDNAVAALTRARWAKAVAFAQASGV